jgi:hypothetical protein
VTVEYLELADYLAIAIEVTGLEVETITRVTKLTSRTPPYTHQQPDSATPSSTSTSSTRPRS